MPAGQPLDPRAPERPTIAGLARQQQRTASVTDRRLNRSTPREPPVHVGPNPPKWAVGMLWYDTESTAENP